MFQMSTSKYLARSAAKYASEAQVDECVAKAVIQIGDPEIILDFRQANGNPHCGSFDKFWQELQMYLDETTLADDERRHLAVSIHHL